MITSTSLKIRRLFLSFVFFLTHQCPSGSSRLKSDGNLKVVEGAGLSGSEDEGAHRYV